jgi:hypothetical protein
MLFMMEWCRQCKGRGAQDSTDVMSNSNATNGNVLSWEGRKNVRRYRRVPMSEELYTVMKMNIISNFGPASAFRTDNFPPPPMPRAYVQDVSFFGCYQQHIN